MPVPYGGGGEDPTPYLFQKRMCLMSLTLSLITCNVLNLSLITCNFSFSRSIFKGLVLQTSKNQGLFGKGLTIPPQTPCKPVDPHFPSQSVLTWMVHLQLLSLHPDKMRWYFKHFTFKTKSNKISINIV